VSEARRHVLYSEVLTVVEGLAESVPQFALHLYTYLWNVRRKRASNAGFVSYHVVFALSTAFSACGIVRVVWRFLRDFEAIMRVLQPPLKQATVESGAIPAGFEHDKTVVLVAVKVNGCSLKDASPELKADKDVALAAIKQNRRSFRYVADHLKADLDVQRAANR